MTTRRTYVVACLAGHGIGPEITAAASRALARLSREHGFDVEELHPPFDTEALTRSGHMLPAATRRATSSADAVLVAGDAAPALDGLRAELDLAARVTRVLDETGEATAFAPLHDMAADWTVERAFATARRRSGHLTSVGVSEGWTALVERHADRHPGVEVEHVSLPDALRRLAAGSVGVLTAEGVLGDAVAEAPRLGGRRRLVASAQLSPSGPSLFGPAEGTTSELAGHGVADPSAMLLATALLLSEGLGRTAAGEALEESLTAALRASRRPSEVSGPGVSATTREFVDAVLGLLRSARRDTEFALGVGP
ncbi:MAG TPA: isocitrate/isopropylmalate family dehydrogenase [Gaiella sp.]|uniref:isocitrate/isopropylmalate family dehydrogenase n=1 Tax=Gaiella sp. TaxID=2663207 RepID=UPI002D7E6589|nr:isocitrate/isopropylmalate family dehydrogenase [Gaiella sp.]HET9285958.1 isocitrate/isopropylmalate family dehydrogenase [Gaiella sp.]